MTPVLQAGIWLRLMAVLGLGGTAVVLLAVLGAWRVASGPWRRTIWQAAVTAVLALVVVEVTGVGPGLGTWLWSRFERSPSEGPRVADAHASPILPAVRQALADSITEDGAAGQRSPVATPVDGPARSDDGRPAAAAAPVWHPGGGEAAAGAAEVPAGPVVPGWLPALVWGLGTAFVALRAVAARLLLAGLRLRRRTVKDGVLLGRVRTVAARMGLGRRVRVAESASLASPLAFGVLRPTLVLPRGFADRLDAGTQKAVLAHELAHLAAADPVWFLLADVATAVLWWHPLAWLARRRLAAACEAAADEASLLVDDGPSRLAACLLRLGRRMRPRRALACLGVSGNYRSGLGRRLARLADLRPETYRPGRRWYRRVLRAAGPMLLVVLMMLVTGWVRPDPGAKGEETMTILRNAWTKSIAGTVVLAVLAGGPDAALADERDEEAGEVRRVERDREGEYPEERHNRDADREREGERRREGDREREHPEARRDRKGERREDEGQRGRREEAVRKTIHRLESHRLNVAFENVPLRDAVAILDRSAEGVDIVLTEGLPERRVSLAVENISLWHALRELTGRGIRLRVLPERVLLVRAQPERREGEREERREHERGREARRVDRHEWGEAVDRCLERLSALRRLKRLASQHGAREQVELVERLIHEHEEQYETLLKRGRARRKGDEEREVDEWRRDRDDDEAGEHEARRDRDRDDEGEEREWRRDRHREDEEEEHEARRERERDRDDDEGERGEGRRRPDRDEEGEERQVRRERDYDDDSEEHEARRERDREGER